MSFCTSLLERGHLPPQSLTHLSAKWVGFLYLHVCPSGAWWQEPFKCRRAQTLMCKKWQVSGTHGFALVGGEQFSLVYRFQSTKLWKCWKTLFRTPAKQEALLSLCLCLVLSLPSSSSLPPFFPLSHIHKAFDQKTRENQSRLINKTRSLNNKSFYKFLNTQLRITLAVLFFYDAFVELLRKNVKTEPWRKELGMDS